ncbi:glycosyl hydrolases family 31-domain-containing protein [Aspergillus californicus]
MVGLASVFAASAGLVSAVRGASSSVFAAEPQFTIPASVSDGATLLPNVDDPQAVDAQLVCPGYRASEVHKTRQGFTASLQLAGEPCNVYGTDVDVLSLSVEYQAADRLNIQIVPTHVDASNASWYFLSEDVIPRAHSSSNGSFAHHNLDFSWSNDPSFHFRVIRKTTGDVLFNTEGSVLVYENQFIEFVSSLPDDYNLYGFGEHTQQFRILDNNTMTMYANDGGNDIDKNMYGSHPFYMDTRYYEMDEVRGTYHRVNASEANNSKEYTSYSHGIFLRNAHGQEVLTKPQSLTWRMLGGTIDLTFYSGPSPAEVTRNYQVSTVGLPAMQKYDTLGFHQARWGYASWSELAGVVDTFEKFGIPLEYIWGDIDYMRGYRNFDNDPIRFPYDEGENFLQKLHNSGRRYVPIVDSALYIPDPANASDEYATYTRGAENDVFIKNPDGSLYVGAVWPGYTVFPDWHHPKAADFWGNELAIWHQKVAYDGIWIDMSEVASFCVGSCGSNNIKLNPAHPPFLLPGQPGNLIFDYPEGFNITNSTEATSAAAASASQAATATAEPSDTTKSVSYLRTTPTPGVRNVNYPRYVLKNMAATGRDLAAQAVSPNATHVDGVQEYDVHNLFGHQILKATYDGLLKILPGKRPFIIGRSTFAGSGKWAGHWGGDNKSRFSAMYFSISQALSFSLFGFPMFGTDSCGFNGNTDEELCNRWMQLSAFFPFCRNHNTLGAISQEPYRWASVIDATKSAMRIRYAVLPYLYTLFHFAHTSGSTVMRALAWEFPNEPLLASIDTQFLLGPSLMIIPVLEPLADSVKGIFPGVGRSQIWYDWYTQMAVDAEPGINTTIPAPLGHIPVFVRGGGILPMQEPALTTEAARKTPWALLTALDSKGTASGQLYLDDGESLYPDATLNVEFKAAHSQLHARAHGEWSELNPLANVTVMGITGEPSSVTFNGHVVPETAVNYNATSEVLFVSGLQNMTARGAWSKSWVLKW